MLSTHFTSPIFLIPEILELILSHLDFHSLLVATNVCRSWRCLAKTSPTLKESLYLTAIPPASTKVILWNAHDASNSYAFPHCALSSNSSAADRSLATIASVNPIFTAQTNSSAMFMRYSIRLALDLRTLKRLLKLDQASILQKCFLTQPPCLEVRIEHLGACCWRRACIGLWKPSQRRIVDPDGLRLGTFADALREILSAQPKGDVCRSASGCPKLDHELALERLAKLQLTAWIPAFVEDASEFALGPAAHSATGHL